MRKKQGTTEKCICVQKESIIENQRFIYFIVMFFYYIKLL